ncbi:transglycosylase SLT domain-containing protein [Pseudidiomarina terrestris]|uniref:transglycosylase SLT domain-containing protein n=1 Tax=Pseudidiomarina terrestris TaxID=2820060 RepID=UPI00264D54C0|nr:MULTISPECIES: transglycosylase SLT domain-containing protein [unclassified Pseudidiomarina]MDN7128002.1 transglycosylase SLT domain-containing protein [Pseudidiomarina sp. 1APR75-33.1]MDN7135661.1 transglycosylase SLT domain-containing protein [Pseudidiomarina sp. 1ASP75-5]
MWLIRTTVCALLFTAVLSTDTRAEPKIHDPDLNGGEQREKQRQLFVKAEYAAKRGRLNEYNQLLDELRDYPLTPYLELERLLQVGYVANEERVLDFFEVLSNTPLDWQLRYPWLDYLAQNNEQQRFLRDFIYPGRVEHRCYFWRFSLSQETQPRDAVMRAVDQLWLTGESLPKACDPLLATWAQAGRRTDDMVWQRAKLAAEDGKHTLLPYLAGLVEAPTSELIKSYRQVRRNPANLVREMDELARQQGTAAERAASIVTYALGRLIWRDPDVAIRTFEDLPEGIVLSQSQRTELEQNFAVALSAKDHSQAHDWLARLEPREHNAATLQWQLAEWVREGDWQALLEDPAAEVGLATEKAQWFYWRGRAYEELGDQQQAATFFAQIADQRSYYGFLAASKLELPLQLAQEDIRYLPQELQAVRALPAVQRAYEFLQLERYIDARREWYQLLQGAEPRRQELLAVLASQWGWHDQAIYTLGQLGEFGAIEQRFPLAYAEEHRENAEAAGIAADWAFAISRRESAFRFDAYSHAGAHGLMQLLPSTARYVGRRDYGRHDLQNTSVNIRLGTRYLADLKRRLGDNWVVATAAYNGGIYRVIDWIPTSPIAIDRWIETIPYRETRDYVKNVLAYQQIYLLLEQPKETRNRFAELVDMKISKAALDL